MIVMIVDKNNIDDTGVIGNPAIYCDMIFIREGNMLTLVKNRFRTDKDISFSADVAMEYVHTMDQLQVVNDKLDSIISKGIPKY